MELVFYLETTGGRRKELRHPTQFSCVASADTPADSLKAVFMIDDPQEWEEETAFIEVQADGKRLFRGICDRQIVKLGQDGCSLTVWGRSDAALLLDNEAIPQEYSRVSVKEMFRKHIAPYGFKDDLAIDGTLYSYQVGKGISEWEAFAAFCRRAVKLTPYVSGDRVSFLTGGGAKRLINTENSSVSMVSRTIKRSEVISKVLIRNENGSYIAGVENKEADKLKIRRRRCLIPSAQWAFPAVDADIKIKQSMDSRNRLEIELMEVVDWGIGDEVSLDIPKIYFRGNIVEKETGVDNGGGFTRIVLE